MIIRDESASNCAERNLKKERTKTIKYDDFFKRNRLL